MIEHGDVVIAGVSGGADSVCLLLTLCSLREKFGFEVKGRFFSQAGDENRQSSEALRSDQFAARGKPILRLSLIHISNNNSYGLNYQKTGKELMSQDEIADENAFLILTSV